MAAFTEEFHYRLAKQPHNFLSKSGHSDTLTPKPQFQTLKGYSLLNFPHYQGPISQMMHELLTEILW